MKVTRVTTHNKTLTMQKQKNFKEGCSLNHLYRLSRVRKKERMEFSKSQKKRGKDQQGPVDQKSLLGDNKHFMSLMIAQGEALNQVLDLNLHLDQDLEEVH